MLYADFQSWLGNGAILIIMVIAMFIQLGKKLAGSSSPVASAVKGAATKKAIGLIGKLLK